MLKLLERISVQESPQFLHRVTDGICGRSFPRFQDYSTIFTIAEFLELVNVITAFLKTAVGKKMNDEELQQSLSGLDSSHQQAIFHCLQSRREEIRHSLIEKTNAISTSQLQDFDWQLKLALSSDKISALQAPLVNLDLDIKENGAITPLSIEMNKDELQNLISSLEAANKVVLQLK
ncbi:COMM domain-containing protein 8 [Polypterus senegalus]|uniref:COMM domain-containing protein 8 n=1 Tax=Polypterus senegalus TaxID=55291 RepID=UPI0019637E96|nr:COMM domain-containing protein 8 [Polypterus senegalus]